MYNLEIKEEADEIFKKLSKKNKKQLEIIKIDQTIIHKLIKLGHFLEGHQNVITNYFKMILEESENEFEKLDYLNELENSVNVYHELLLHSLSMIVSLTDGYNLVTYYKIYEIFDKMNIFNSNPKFISVTLDIYTPKSSR